MPIVGGTGVFRYARGYALVKTVSLSAKTGDAAVKYNYTMCLCCTTDKGNAICITSCGREM
ncbi:dirigent protein 19-like [Prunus yedoensis var. nudiflora]|uniref:Dirigent protein n=1 Tax=Prunus yedoensis var. nudiflora TaxID=2094558 RepID=A0A314Z4H5_PRUYE|nr:dirigent protein 19-like [Prunus yedoensis var. nudiflora]